MSDVDFGLGSGANYLKIDARAGCFKIRSGDDDLTFRDATFEIDLYNLQTGWLAFIKGEGPRFVPDVHSPQPASVGGIEFKKGFKVNIFGTEPVDVLGEPLGLREVASTAYVTRRAMAKLHTTFWTDKNVRGQEQVPVVHVETFVASSFKNGSAYAPEFNIVSWVARRREFIDAAGSAAAAPAARPNVAPDHQAPITADTATGSVDPDDSAYLAKL